MSRAASDEESELSTVKQESTASSKGFIDNEADLSDGDDEDQEVDSSEDDEDDDDEEAQRKVAEGFIVSDGDEEEDAERKRKKKHKKRRAERRVEEDELDEDDLDLVRENQGALPSHVADQSKYKRLKRGGDADDEDTVSVAGSRSKSGLIDMFSDEEAGSGDEQQEGDGGDDEDDDDDDLMALSRQRQQQQQHRQAVDEFEDFIEDDEFDDDEDKDERIARMRSVKAQNRMNNFTANSQIDQDKLDELYEIFGDGEEYAWALEADNLEDDQDMEEDEYDDNGYLVKKSTRSKQPKALNDVFEYEELKSHLLTDKDNEIRITDVPERYQSYRSSISNYNLDDDDFRDKQDWVADTLYEEKRANFTNKEHLIEPFKQATRDIVAFVARDNLEVPTIWNCRKDYCLYRDTSTPEGKIEKFLNENDLWRIVQLDIEFHTLFEKKNMVSKMFSSLSVEDKFYNECMRLANNVVDLQDLHDYVSFTYSIELKELQNSEATPDNGDGSSKTKTRTKQHAKYASYDRVKTDPIYAVVEAIGVSHTVLGENLDGPQPVIPIEDVDVSFESMIGEYIDKSDLFDTHPKAIDAVKYTFAEQLFNSPKVRSALRKTFERYSSVSVKLTEKGRIKINKSSPYSDFKYLINKSIVTFESTPDLFLRMLEAESLGYISIDISLKETFDAYKEHIYNALSSSGTTDVNNSWNKLRRESLEIAFKKIVPLVTLDVKEKIRATCERLLFFQVRDRFIDKVDQTPFHPIPSNNGTVPKVLAISNGDGKKDAAVIAIALDYDGTIVDHIKFEVDYKTEKFETQLLQIIRKFKPEVIAISGYSVSTSPLFQKISSIVQQHKLIVPADDSYDDVDQDIPLPCIWVHNETARIFEHSSKAQLEFSDKPVVARFVIGIARYVQSPLLEYMVLGDAVSSVYIHRYQNYLNPQRLSALIESVFVDMTCLVGVKINDAIRSQYLSTMLQYVAGFGPRKAMSLIKNIESNGGSLLKREDLILNELTTRNVFINCASFLEIPLPDRYDKDTEPLDATRIHPEDYELARKMAADALDLNEEDKAEVEEEDGGIIGSLYNEGVNKLDDLLLDRYADQLEQHGHKKRVTLELIKAELKENYEELRKKFRILSEEEVFFILTNEHKETFATGVLVTVIVQRVDNRFLLVSTQSGIMGNISRSNIVDYADQRNLLSIYQVGQAIQAVVKSIDYHSFRCELSLLKTDISQAKSRSTERRRQGLWDFEAEANDRQIEVEKTQKEQRSKRVIKHPSFQNLDSKQAEQYLASRENGEFVIRPSSKGNDHITVTWKVDNNLYQHIDVVEKNKLNEYSIGKTLLVGDYVYHDLDELIVNHIQETFARVTQMINHDKFRTGPLQEVKDWLTRYSEANKTRSCYCFCYNHRDAGWFYLLFKMSPSSKIVTWHVKALPNGYLFNKNVYPDMVSLCNGFKTVVANNRKQAGPGVGSYTSYGAQTHYGQGRGYTAYGR